jgi:hypothetical protein
VALLFVFCAPAFAQSKGSAAKRVTHNFDAALEFSDYEYEEPGHMKVYGSMSGLSVQYLLDGRFNESLSGQLRARYHYMSSASEDLTYEGSYIVSGEKLKYKGDTFRYNDFVLALGVEARLTQKFSTAPYIGFGYRYHVDEKDSMPGDYEREQVYYYMPVGADWKLSMPHGWGVAFNTEVDFLLSGENTTHLYDRYGRDQKLKFRQTSGYGLRFSVKGEKDFGKVKAFVEPFYRYWNIAESDSQEGDLYCCTVGTTEIWVRTPLYEPKNNTKEFGLKIGVSF